MPAKPPSQREIADAAGVNRSTVSRALGNDPRIKAATRKHVIAVARKLGWKPNPLATAYATHIKSLKPPKYRANLAMVLPFRQTSHYAHHSRRVHKGASARGRQLGFNIDILWLRDVNYDFRRLERQLRSRGIPGVMFYNFHEYPLHYEEMNWSPFAAAMWGVDIPELPVHYAGHHHSHGMRLILAKLHQYGYRRIGISLSRDQDELSDHAYFSAAAFAAKMPPPGTTVSFHPLRSWVGDAKDRAALQTWLRRTRPQVVVGEGAVWDTIQEMGWRVPEDIAFASPFWAGGQWQHVAGVDQCPEVLGAHLVDLVSGQLFRNEYGIPKNRQVLLNEGVWMDGPSVPDLRTAKRPALVAPRRRG